MAAPDADGFDADEFRAAIRFAMKMGEDPADGAVFIMAAVTDPDDTTVDAHGVPWDPNEVGSLPEPGEEIAALCAIEFFDQAGILTLGVDTEVAKVLVTLLDEDWITVSECIAIRLGDIVYKRDRKRPPVGLFSVAVHQVQFIAGDL